jgi:ribonuclease P protein component
MSQSVSPESRRARTEAFPRSVRIAARRDFTLTYESGRKYHGRLAVVFARPRNGAGRLGITATRKVGNAVVRNRARRRVREIYRRWRAIQPLAAGLDVVVNVTAASASAPHAAFAAELATLLDRAATGARAEKT